MNSASTYVVPRFPLLHRAVCRPALETCQPAALPPRASLLPSPAWRRRGKAGQPSRGFRIGVLLGAILALTGGHALASSKSKKAVKPVAKVEPEPTEAPATPTPPPPGSSPLAELKKSNAALKKLFAKSAPSWSPEQDVKRSEMRKIVNGFLDFEELSHRALARHWESLDNKQRSEFVSVLRELIERNYIKQVHGQPDYDVSFHKETIAGTEATVVATLHGKSRGKKVTVEMDYKLLHKGNRWLVYDVVTDEQSMLETYRAEFNKTIRKESFDALLKRMKKRLEKTE